jgi:hypothetical protein
MKLPLELLEHQEIEAYPFSKEISKPYGVLDTIIDWCDHEMLSDWRWQLVSSSSNNSPGRYIFYFTSGRDHFAFVLKWA